MSSIQSSYLSQRKLASFVVLLLYPSSTYESNCYLLSEPDFERWKQDFALYLKVVGNNITTSVENFAFVVGSSGIWSSEYYTYADSGYVPPATTLIDLGKDIYIGVPGEPNLLHLRLVQLPGSVETLGKGGKTGYVPIECNADIFVTTDGLSYMNVSVARSL